VRARLEEITNWPELADVAQYRVKALAETCGTTARKLERFFLVRSGVTPHCWLNDLRQSRGVALLLAGKSVKEVALDLGYRDPCNFSRDFRRFHGVSPSDVFSSSRAHLSHFDTSLSLVREKSSALMIPRHTSNDPLTAL
jgi:transcriptional regulator GlxA family with amidase domain